MSERSGHTLAGDIEFIIGKLLGPTGAVDSFAAYDPHLAESSDAGARNDAFLILLAGEGHPGYEKASSRLTSLAGAEEWSDVARFYLDARPRIRRELERVAREDQTFTRRAREVAEWLSVEANADKREEKTERIWSVFFPEAVGLRSRRKEHVDALRARRTVVITKDNPQSIDTPARQILFTSNVLLTTPPASKNIDELPFSEPLKSKLRETTEEPQLYWYDHPVQIGVEPEKNEILYGLLGLDRAIEFERTRGNVPAEVRIACALSVSVTHKGLQSIARTYIEEELVRAGGLRNIDVYVFAEADTDRLVEEVLAPVASHYLDREDAARSLAMFGVDGAYGRHYTFLKAIVALWGVLIDTDVLATFKIDLDQVFPQQELVEQTGASALEHLTTPLWGDEGLDSDGRPVELGLIAGALVNQSDIGMGVFTPDISYPERELSPDEHVFFSTLPQALSTEAEMMTRYDTPPLDGKTRCIQRIHVTGGTNGITVGCLRRHRLFTPSFFGRAEDQAFILSAISKADPRPVYLHEPGLIMRHDKHAFAQEAIETAYVGKLLGDYIRILYFSEYARVLAGDARKIKSEIDPFTGCFVSRIPITVVYLRFALKASSFFAAGSEERGEEFVRGGAERIGRALEFTEGEDSDLERIYRGEREGWDLFYDTLDALEKAIDSGDTFAVRLREKAGAIVNECALPNP
jgi:hypothetical protein